MKAGPKAQVTAGPLDLSMLPARRDHRRVAAFCAEYLRVPRGHGALEPFRLRPWQREIVRGLYPARGARPRTGLVSLPRGNGKSTLAAALGLYALLADDEEGAEVLCVATDERQAKIVFNAARRMVELDDRLADRVQVYQDKLRFPERDATFAPLPADPSALQGWAPSMTVVDELHVVDEAVWEAMTLAAGKRPQSLTVAISTPAADKDSVMWRLIQHGRSGDDGAAFYLKEYAAPDGCPVDDEDAWRTANPALGDFLSVDALRGNLSTTREDAFRRFRLGQWVGRASSWLPWGAWEALAEPREVPDGERVVLGFDGSTSGDATALVGVVPGESPYVFLLGLWESTGNGWRVPRHEVEARLEEAHNRWQVLEVAVDPWGWQSEIEAWERRYGARRIVSMNTANRAVMGPACDRLAGLVLEGRLRHDGSERLADHVGNAVPIETPHGAVIVKDKRSSPRRIDAAVAAILAVDRAAEYAVKRRGMVVHR